MNLTDVCIYLKLKGVSAEAIKECECVYIEKMIPYYNNSNEYHFWIQKFRKKDVLVVVKPQSYDIYIIFDSKIKKTHFSLLVNDKSFYDNYFPCSV